MPVLPEDTKRYVEFLDGQIKMLGAFDFKEDTMLWHYTTGPGLIGIVGSGTMYSTQVSCLSDSSEIRYASALFKHALTSLLPAYADDQPVWNFIADYVKLVEELPDHPTHAPSPFFVTCFSQMEDDLSQWRSYSGGENGYALGFRVGSLFGAPNSWLVRVNYDKTLHEKLASIVAKATVEFFKEGIINKRAETPEKWKEEFLTFWDPFITRLAPMVKDSSFSAEQEYRVVHEFQRGELRDMIFLQKKTMMSRHLPLSFPRAIEAWVPRLPLEKVIVGPCRHLEITRVSVDTLMRKMGYGTGMVSSSVRPFQEP